MAEKYYKKKILNLQDFWERRLAEETPGTGSLEWTR
jgi:hypothetical protein